MFQTDGHHHEESSDQYADHQQGTNQFQGSWEGHGGMANSSHYRKGVQAQAEGDNVAVSADSNLKNQHKRNRHHKKETGSGRKNDNSHKWGKANFGSFDW